MKKIGSMLVLLVVLVVMIGVFANFAAADEDGQWTTQDHVFGVDAYAYRYNPTYKYLDIRTFYGWSGYMCSLYGLESPCLRISAEDWPGYGYAVIPYQPVKDKDTTITLQFQWRSPCTDETTLTFSYEGDLDKYMDSSKQWQDEKLVLKDERDGQKGQGGPIHAEVTLCGGSPFTFTDPEYTFFDLFKAKHFSR
jgi:hypothetical protein